MDFHLNPGNQFFDDMEQLKVGSLCPKTTNESSTSPSSTTPSFTQEFTDLERFKTPVLVFNL